LNVGAPGYRTKESKDQNRSSNQCVQVFENHEASYREKFVLPSDGM
jgi:hypothetical protein